jgi:tRNA-dihydrouridine synthase
VFEVINLRYNCSIMSNFWSSLPKPCFILAPMDDVTDIVFRDVVESVAAPDVFFTEFTSTDGLASPGRERVMEKLARNPESRYPLVTQLWGNKPELYEKAAREVAQMGFAGIDINMGCPERGIVARGCCGGLIGCNHEAAEIIKATKAGAGELPVSVKTRIGLDKIITEAWFSFLLQQDLAAITVHGRTVREMSRVPAHWDEIAKVVTLRNELAPNTLIIGNGDVANRADGLRRVGESGVDGVMIGRGIFHDIFAFDSEPSVHSSEEMITILLDHLNRYEADGQRRSFQTLKKFFKLYINGWYGAAELRARLMETSTPAEVRDILAETGITVGIQ